MAAWSGFTDDDLRRMKNPSQEDDKKPRVKRIARQPRQAPVQRQKIDKSESSIRENGKGNALPTNARLAPQKVQEDAVRQQNSTSSLKNDDSINKEKDEKTIDDVIAPTTPETAETKEVKELDEEEAMSFEKEHGAKFQQQQKVIEEANKQKRALLSRAIEERRKKAKAESVKLVKIQRELSHLDSLLSGDVGIIRDKIEIASLDYVQAQKRYEKSEREFVEAKMDLYEKSEAKEKLTEHLYTIIHRNEVRKAKKLVELMEALAMEVSAEEMEMAIPAIPPLTNFNTVTTLHQPGHHQVSKPEDDNGKDKNHNKEQTQAHAPADSQSNETNSSPSTGESHPPVDVKSEQGTTSTSEKSDAPGNDGKALSGQEKRLDGQDQESNNNSVKIDDKDDNAESSSSQNADAKTVVADQSSIPQATPTPSENATDSIVTPVQAPLATTITSSTTSSATTTPTSSEQQPSSPSSEQNLPIKPKEETPVKGWSLPFM